MEDLSKYPTKLTTKEDYEYIRHNFPEEYWKADFSKLFYDSMEYRVIGTCAVQPLPIKKGDDEDRKYRVYSKEDISDIIEQKELSKMIEECDDVKNVNIDYDKSIIHDSRIEVMKHPDYPYSHCFMLISVEKENSKAKKLGYNIEDVLAISLGIINAQEEMNEQQKKMEKAINSKVEKLNQEIKELDDEEEKK